MGLIYFAQYTRFVLSARLCIYINIILVGIIVLSNFTIPSKSYYLAYVGTSKLIPQMPDYLRCEFSSGTSLEVEAYNYAIDYDTSVVLLALLPFFLFIVVLFLGTLEKNLGGDLPN